MALVLHYARRGIGLCRLVRLTMEWELPRRMRWRTRAEKKDPTGLALPTRPIEEADERVVAVALHATADYCALKHVGRGKQRVRAMGRL